MKGNMQSILIQMYYPDTGQLHLNLQSRYIWSLWENLNQVIRDDQCFTYYLLIRDLGSGIFKIYCSITVTYCYKKYIYKVDFQFFLFGVTVFIALSIVHKTSMY